MVGVGVAVLLFGLDLTQANLPVVIVCILLVSFTTAGIGLILGSIALVTREAWMLANIVYLGLLVFCGINFPTEVLPTPLRLVSYSLPLTRGLAAARQALIGAGWSTVASLLGGEVVIGLVYTLAGYALFHYIEKWSLASGQLEAV